MKEGRTFQPSQGLQNPLPGHRQQERGTVFHHLDEDAAASDQKVWAELVITGHTDDEFRHHILDHLFDQEGLRELRHLGHRARNLVGTAEVDLDASGLGLVGNPKFGGIFTFIQEFQGFISPGILSIFLFGVLVHRAPGACGTVGLIINPILYGALKYFAPNIAFLNRMAITTAPSSLGSAPIDLSGLRTRQMTRAGSGC